jgi:hypothetical protein
MGIVEVSVTDEDYKYDASRQQPVITRNQAGFMCCFGPRGHVFGYKGRMWYYLTLCGNWPPVLMTGTGARHGLEITFSHGLFVEEALPVDIPRYTLAVYDTEAGRSPRRGRGRHVRELVCYAQAYRVTHLLIRVQRWFRRVLGMLRSRRLAVAMSLHDRLGVGCELGGLGPDLLAVVVECV